MATSFCDTFGHLLCRLSCERAQITSYGKLLCTQQGRLAIQKLVPDLAGTLFGWLTFFEGEQSMVFWNDLPPPPRLQVLQTGKKIDIFVPEEARIALRRSMYSMSLFA